MTWEEIFLRLSVAFLLAGAIGLELRNATPPNYYRCNNFCRF